MYAIKAVFNILVHRTVVFLEGMFDSGVWERKSSVIIDLKNNLTLGVGLKTCSAPAGGNPIKYIGVLWYIDP